MKKIPTLFKRLYDGHKIVGITDEIAPGCEEAFKHGCATVKVDGSCCAVIDGVFYKRFDAKKGRKIPEGSIPCCDPDPVTGHWPHWVKVDPDNPADKWFMEAYKNTTKRLEIWDFPEITYEAIGPHFQGNPYNLQEDMIYPHGIDMIFVSRDYESIREYLRTHEIEGIVFWLHGEPVCKIKRSDFGFEWPVK